MGVSRRLDELLKKTSNYRQFEESNYPHNISRRADPRARAHRRVREARGTPVYLLLPPGSALPRILKPSLRRSSRNRKSLPRTSRSRPRKNRYMRPSLVPFVSRLSFSFRPPALLSASLSSSHALRFSPRPIVISGDSGRSLSPFRSLSRVCIIITPTTLLRTIEMIFFLE